MNHGSTHDVYTVIHGNILRVVSDLKVYINIQILFEIFEMTILFNFWTFNIYNFSFLFPVLKEVISFGNDFSIQYRKVRKTPRFLHKGS